MKRQMASVVMVLTMATGLIGCGGGADHASAPNEVKIQFMHQQVEQERQDIVAAIIAQFEKENPGITVEAIPVNEDDYDSKIVALGGSGELPAVIEYSQDQAKTSVTNQFTDVDAVKAVIEEKGEDAFFEGALEVLKTEDGNDYVGVPIAGWVQGIWVNQAMLTEKGLDLPQNWDDLLVIAAAFHDPANKKFGIALPTADTAFTEQVFSQYALSNNANVFGKDGQITFDTPQMREALAFYKELASYSMPGSTEVADVKDAFVGKNAPMAMYSTYILNAVVKAGFINDLALVLPSNDQEAAYGSITTLGIASGMDPEKTAAAKKFVSFLLEDEHNIEWLHMAPGGVQPVLVSVNGSEAYEDNDAIKQFAHLSDGIAAAFENLQLFGTVDGKNFMIMGDITNKGIISKTVNNIVVQNADIDKEIQAAQAAIEGLVK